MQRGKLIIAAALAASSVSLTSGVGVAQEAPVATYKSSVDLVRVAAVVRDRKGRFVEGLTVGDFEVFNSGVRAPINDFRPDQSGVSIALLFDISGSMERLLGTARESASHLLSWLEAERDEAAIFTFDSQLDEVTPFTTGLAKLPHRLQTVTPFGATSLHDAIAQTAERVGAREGRRRAVVVFTDGNDTFSRMKPSEVSGLASAIDVPIYIVGVVSNLDNPSVETSVFGPEGSPLAGPLSDLTMWTGGNTFVPSTPAQRSLVARQIVDELRHQYLIAIEASGRPGWHPLEVRARGKDLVVRARSGYIAGQSRPISQ
jgi:Ca-activated chloride channel family protein